MLGCHYKSGYSQQYFIVRFVCKFPKIEMTLGTHVMSNDFYEVFNILSLKGS